MQLRVAPHLLYAMGNIAYIGSQRQAGLCICASYLPFSTKCHLAHILHAIYIFSTLTSIEYFPVQLSLAHACRSDGTQSLICSFITSGLGEVISFS